MTDLAFDATLRAAAPRQAQRRAAIPANDSAPALLPAVLLEPWDLRQKVRETKTGSLIIFVVDASGSMGAQRRMAAVKGAVLSLLLDAYQRRDRVAMISFRGSGAQVMLPPTGSVDRAQVCLQEMPTGGRTPLGQGLFEGAGTGGSRDYERPGRVCLKSSCFLTAGPTSACPTLVSLMRAQMTAGSKPALPPTEDSRISETCRRWLLSYRHSRCLR